MSDKKVSEMKNVQDVTEQQQVQTFNLTMDVNELNVVFSALQELPHRVADPVLKKLISQAQSQAQ